MINKANNTDISLGLGGKPYPEMVAYWNFYQTDEKIQVNWIFFTHIDNLSFLGGLVGLGFRFAGVLMIAYTFRLNEINVLFFQ